MSSTEESASDLFKKFESVSREVLEMQKKYEDCRNMSVKSSFKADLEWLQWKAEKASKEWVEADTAEKYARSNAMSVSL